MGRAPCCDKTKVKRGPWSPDEDATLKSYVEKNGTGGNWIALPQKAGLRRCGKSCRLRWLNYLRPDIKHGGFTDEEDKVICSLYKSLGSRWSIIASQLPGRTDNDVKNYWNTKLKKKLFSSHPPPITTGTLKPTPRSPALLPPPPPPPSSTLNKAETFAFSTADPSTFPLMTQEPAFHLPYADPYVSLWPTTNVPSPPPPAPAPAPENISAPSTSLTTDNGSSSSCSSNGLWLENEGYLMDMALVASSPDNLDWTLQSWVGGFETQDPTFPITWPPLEVCNSQDLHQTITYS